MRKFIFIISIFWSVTANAQFPYVKKLNYPEQLPTQVVYDMLADSKGYIWLGTDKGLYRFNGRSFVSIPFNNTSSKAVSFLQEDQNGVVWCMNFYNQLFYCKQDTLQQFSIDPQVAKNVSTFNNVNVGAKNLWFNSYSSIYQLDKYSRKMLQTIETPKQYNQIISSCLFNNVFYAFSSAGFLYTQGPNKKGWDSIDQSYSDLKFLVENDQLIAVGTGLERTAPFEIKNEKRTLLKQIDLPGDIYIFQGVLVNKHEYWLCTQNGAYEWNKETGETKCYLPNERVSDVVKDYQGNYWISTLDNGVFICSSLANTLIKIYDNPLLDNFAKLQGLPNGEIIVGNSQGQMSKLNLDDRQVFQYNLLKMRETEFLSFDTCNQLIISNRGVFKQDQKEPIELYDYSKGAQRDKFGNLIVSAFNGAYIINNHFNQVRRMPELACPLYQMKTIDSSLGDVFHNILWLRKKRSITGLSASDKSGFWIAYEDGLYLYNYDGTVKILKDKGGNPVIGKSMIQLPEDDLVVGTSTRGVMFFKNGLIKKTYDETNGLSSNNVRKIISQDNFIWVLTDAGLDRINESNGIITNYLEEYGLSNIIINDFIIQSDKILFATPTGILLRFNVPRYSNFEIKFPLLRATSDGIEIANGGTLPGNHQDINFYFEALHYISPASVSYLYRVKGIDTVWRQVSIFNNQLIFNRLSPGKYTFEIQAIAGLIYKSSIRQFSFIVPKPFWLTNGFIGAFSLTLLFLFWWLLKQWEKNLLKKQNIKAQLLKSQLVALRAQMNPHFLYNVLNTVQGLVYGNRKTEAGALLGNFSDLMLKTLNASDKQLLSLQDEIENVRLYLELEKARFDEGFEYHIGIINIADLSEIFIPSLLLQPFIENAVKHGLMHKKGPKRVDIKFEPSDESFKITIEDNGIGRMQSMEINQRTKSKPASFATAAFNERMDLFNRLYKRKITFEIIDKFDERNNPTGTKVVIVIPDYRNDPQTL
jgi:ligand-binding sensor domain-containing protein